MDDLDRRIDELYASAPEGFTEARNTLAAELRKEDRRDEEKRVKTLRRPSVAAWAANSVARGEPELVEQLIAAGGELRSAQQRALSGRKAEGLREATEHRRELVVRLRDAAADVLREEGKDPSNLLDDLMLTFEAASVDDEAAELLRAGRLERALTPPSGLGEATGLRVLEGGRAKEAPPEDRREKARAERELAKAERDLAKATEKERSARAKAEALRRELAELRASVERTTAALRKADADVREAARETKRAEGAVRSARRA